jgi:type IV pilus assembly protein PilV
MHIYSKQAGATMIEVLISILILSFGMIGLAGLQSVASKSTQSAFLRSQAAALATDMSDRMRANYKSVVAGDYNRLPGDAVPTGTSIAQTDLNRWLGNVQSSLPNGQGCIAHNQTTKITTVIVAWNDTRNAGATALTTCERPAVSISSLTQAFEFQTMLCAGADCL